MSYEEYLGRRLAQLRNEKNISAREMSLAIGQSPNYINNIESRGALPSIATFFYICDYLAITPKDFFDNDIAYPEMHRDIINNLQYLNKEQLTHIDGLIKSIREMLQK